MIWHAVIGMMMHCAVTYYQGVSTNTAEGLLSEAAVEKRFGEDSQGALHGADLITARISNHHISGICSIIKHQQSDEK